MLWSWLWGSTYIYDPSTRLPQSSLTEAMVWSQTVGRQEEGGQEKDDLEEESSGANNLALLSRFSKKFMNIFRYSF